MKDENYLKFVARKDKALATIILTVQPFQLLYLMGDPQNSSEVWQKTGKSVSEKNMCEVAAAAGTLFLEAQSGQFCTGTYES